MPKPSKLGLSSFRQVMKELKPFIPRNYGVLLAESEKYKHLDFDLLRQAFALRRVYWEGLEALRTIARKEPVERKPRKKHEKRQLAVA